MFRPSSFALACLFVFAAVAPSAHAQVPAASAAPGRGWLDVNFLSLRSNQGEQGYAASDIIFLERRTFGTGYPKLPSAQGLGIDVGFLANPRFAVGITFTPVNYEYVVGLAVEVPHPFFRNRHASDLDVTANRVTREDRALDVSLIYIADTPDAWRVRLFGGPTWFRVKQDMVNDIIYSQVYNLLGFNSVEVSRYEARTTEGTAWGFHAGVDVAYFFSRHVGAGGVVRFNRGTVTVDEPLSGDEADLDAGHVTVGGGLRLRF